MVHALRETWRVLAPHGILLDLRPLAMDFPLEVLTSSGDMVTGHVGGSPGLPGDIGCRAALKQMVSEGRLRRDAVHYFSYAFYWDTFEDLAEFLVDHWKLRYRQPSRSSLATSQRLLQRFRWARLRVREIILLARYRRQDQGRH